MSDPVDKAEFVKEYESAQQHDKYAVVVFYVIMGTLITAQSLLFWWKRKHKRTYELVTLLGLWLVPPIVSAHFHFWQFLAVWCLFTASTGYMLWRCTQRPMPRTTPRLVYGWFLGLYKVSVAAGLCGYVLLFGEVFGAGLLLRPAGVPASLSLLLVWYGVYFGIMGRDCAEVAADRLALSIGSRRQLAVSVRECSLCGGELTDFSSVGSGAGNGSAAREALGGDATVQLSCKHCFHDQCIRGWTIVGKKDTCPACLEKVDLRSVFQDRPWETRNLSWIQMLDAVRYLVAWNPVVLVLLHFGLHFLGLERHVHHRGPYPLGSANATALNSTVQHAVNSSLLNGTGTALGGLLGGAEGVAAAANATLLGVVADAAAGGGSLGGAGVVQ
ncbi:hypothetical protein WJX81_005662 [Elliptochloris bilobata]|uniref:RING-type domain-containing protein n=1 Tax=Elliptochloris bilobata TaxID=381761 RepID=A0AAW1RHL5_9CHLO